MQLSYSDGYASGHSMYRSNTTDGWWDYAFTGSKNKVPATLGDFLEYITNKEDVLKAFKKNGYTWIVCSCYCCAGAMGLICYEYAPYPIPEKYKPVTESPSPSGHYFKVEYNEYQPLNSKLICYQS